MNLTDFTPIRDLCQPAEGAMRFGMAPFGRSLGGRPSAPDDDRRSTGVTPKRMATYSLDSWPQVLSAFAIHRGASASLPFDKTLTKSSSLNDHKPPPGLKGASQSNTDRRTPFPGWI